MGLIFTNEEGKTCTEEEVIDYCNGLLTEKKAYDTVNQPQHYTHGNIECIDAMLESQGRAAVQYFCICNAFKYIWRARYKNGVEDIRKAQWYLNKYIELEEKE